MGILVLDKCCLCIDLRVGCLIIGYLNLIGEILSLILLGMMATTGVAIIAFAENDREWKLDYAVAFTVLIVTTILFLLVVLFLAFTIVLLVGIHQNKRGHVKVYLIYSIIFQVISFIIFLASLATQPSATEVIKNTVIIILQLYFLLVIKTYYRKMEDNPPKEPLYYKA